MGALIGEYESSDDNISDESEKESFVGIRASHSPPSPPNEDLPPEPIEMISVPKELEPQQQAREIRTDEGEQRRRRQRLEEWKRKRKATELANGQIT